MEKKSAVNPFCAVFPTEVSCTVPNVGASGIAQHHNGMCILTQNIYNEKLFLVLWWYHMVPMVVSIYCRAE